MRRVLPIVILIILASAILAAGCTSRETTPSAPEGDALFSKAEQEFQKQNFHAADELFTRAQEQYIAAGNTSAARYARDRASIARMMVLEYPYNRSEMVAILDERFPDTSADRKAYWLSCEKSQCIRSDGEFWYLDRTVNNIMYHNTDIMRKSTAAKGDTPYYDQLVPYALAPSVPDSGNYRNPITWEGIETLNIPSGELPKTGTFRVWIPLPIETDSQRNVTIISIEPAQYLKSQTGTQADIGIAYLEVPLDQVTGSHLNISVKFRFTQYEQRFVIDPEKVGSYNTSDPEYIRYTAPGRNIALTPELIKEAREVIGNETHPYLKAQKIYWHVIEMPYSSISYARLLANGTGQPVTEYVRTTGYGDCGAQSAYFAALCRAVGIPARAIGGRQMVPGYGGGHFWSEFYLPGYGWIPNDVTISEGADWSPNATDADRHRYKAYFAENLDPYRYIIQRDIDIPFVPDPGDETMQDMTFQEAKAICETCPVDPKFWLPQYWKVSMEEV